MSHPNVAAPNARGVERIYPHHGGWVKVVPGFLAPHQRFLERLVAELPLATQELILFGRPVRTPRLTSWHGESGLKYRYSGRTFEPAPFTPALFEVRRRLRDAAGLDFNAVLANYYRDGSDGMGFHADNEKELGPSPKDVRIASVSLGARRRFVLKARKGDERWSWALGEGDLLLMGGTLQAHYQHGIPKTKRSVGPRLNLTFRVICS